jgi:LacI family transcriptional regulator
LAATIHDVARISRVSIGTVSRVINNSPRVDPGTRARVLRAIEDLDFRPSRLGRRLSTGKTHSIAVVVPFLTRESVVERLRGIAGVLVSTDYDLVVFNLETREQLDHALAQVVRRDRVDGFILIGSTPSDDELAAIEKTGQACVLLDARHPRLPSVAGNDVKGGRLAARHLLGLGHRRIAFIGEEPREAFNTPASRLRGRGVRLELRANGLELTPEYTAVGEQGRGRARELALGLLALPEPPTAIICASDIQALGALEAARELDIAVPAELSVVGYDDLEIAGHLGLTTIRQALFESGMQAARMLVAQLSGGPPRQSVALIDIMLVARATSGPPGRAQARSRRTTSRKCRRAASGAADR